MSEKKDIVAPEERFFITLSSAAAVLQKTVEEEVRMAGLSVAQYTLLRIVEHNPGITAGEARGRMYSSAPAVAQLVKELARKNLLRQERDANDARRLPLKLTSKGTQALKKAKKSVGRLVEEMQLPAGLLESALKNLSLFLSSLPSHVARPTTVDA